MIDIRASAIIPRPVEEVFEFITNLENWPQWEKHISDVSRISPNGKGVGATYRYTTRIAGKPVPSTMVVTAYRPHEEFAFEGDWTGPVRPHGRIHFERVEGGTRVTMHMQPRTRLGFKFLEHKISRVMREAQEKGLAHLQARFANGAQGRAS